MGIIQFLKELHKYNVWQEGGSGGDWGAVSMGPPNIPDGTKIIPLKPAMRIIKCKSWSYLSCENVKIYIVFWLPWWLSSKESACNAGDAVSVPEWGRSPGGGNGNPLQDSCQENPMDREDWQATVHRFTKSQTRLKRLSTHAQCVLQ